MYNAINSKYTYKGTDVLKNKLDIKDEELLKEYETRIMYVVQNHEENEIEENVAFSIRPEYQRREHVIIEETETNEEYNRRILENRQIEQQQIE